MNRTDRWHCRDAFAGGFVAGIVEGKPLEESIDMGQWLASLSIRELGPSYVTPISDPPFHPLRIQSPPRKHITHMPRRSSQPPSSSTAIDPLTHSPPPSRLHPQLTNQPATPSLNTPTTHPTRRTRKHSTSSFTARRFGGGDGNRSSTTGGIQLPEKGRIL